MHKQVHGILLLDKPVDMTSNYALQKVKRLFHAKKAGHTGSLDPIATGMLPICFGEATKFSQFLLESDKSYQVVAKLGIQTTTGDCEGEVVATKPVAKMTKSHIEQVMTQFMGQIEQVPPMYSAVKYQGKPLYKWARSGHEVERKPRHVTIFSLLLNQVVEDQLIFHVHCSKGTYVRTLVEDIGRELGCYGHVAQLRRTQVTPYRDAAMHTLSALTSIVEREGVDALAASLLPMETAVQAFPAVTLSISVAFYLRMGQPVRTLLSLTAGSFVRLLSEEGKFLGMGEMMLDGRVRPYRLIAT